MFVPGRLSGPDCAGVTADGTALADLGPGDTPVVGANWLPLQSLVEVGGTVYRIADRGGPGLNLVGRLDVYTPEGHEAALALGRARGVEVRVVMLPEPKKIL
jgi:3D (Asp-Asp-Asp) domain-containing protein